MNMLVRAELTKITRQRGLLVCGFLLIPALTMIATLLLNAIPVVNGQAVASVPVLRTTTRSLMVAGNPIAQLLYALGAAGIFAVDYRYSGWRQVVPRAGRTRPLAAKVLCFAVLAGISLVLVIAGDVLALMVTTLARGQFAPTTDWTSTGFMRLCGSLVISLAELLALGAVAAISATLTRSLMAATIVPFLLGLAASSVKAYTTTGLANMPLPTFAADTLRAGLSGGWASSLIWNAAVLAGWCAIGFGSALLVLRQQDLVAE